MHEYGLARTLLSQIEEIRRREGASRVVSVNVSVGEFAGVDGELLELAFRHVTEDTAADDAKLIIDKVSLAARCDGCKLEFPVQRFRFLCPHCGSGEVTVVRGEELMLQRLELESETP